MLATLSVTINNYCYHSHPLTIIDNAARRQREVLYRPQYVSLKSTLTLFHDKDIGISSQGGIFEGWSIKENVFRIEFYFKNRSLAPGILVGSLKKST